MLTYKLLEKEESNRIDEIIEFIYHEARKICELIIDNSYYIKRYEFDDMLYYVHVKNGSVVKVCIYRKVRKED